MYVHLYKNEQKGLCPGGILSYIQLEALYRVRIPFDEKWLVLSDRYPRFAMVLFAVA